MKPSIGRIVHYYPQGSNRAPRAAIITQVHGDFCVNLQAFPASEFPSELTSVTEGDADQSDPSSDTWRWPPRVG